MSNHQKANNDNETLVLRAELFDTLHADLRNIEQAMMNYVKTETEAANALPIGSEQRALHIGRADGVVGIGSALHEALAAIDAKLQEAGLLGSNQRPIQ